MRQIRVAAIFMLAWIGRAFSDDVIGQAMVIDGDTLEIHGTRIRLWGIDAPSRRFYWRRAAVLEDTR
ncbi:MAG: hypothetical protein ACJ8EF_21610 [Bradyrhizobium sp.]